MRRQILPLAVSLACLTMSAAGQDATAPAPAQHNVIDHTERNVFSVDWHRQGQAMVAIRPAFPAAEKDAGRSGLVDVTLSVGNGGTLKNVGAMTSEPKNPAFEQSVRHALDKWLFYVWIDPDCTPVAASARYRFTFANSGGEAKVTMARLDEPVEPTAPNLSGSSLLEWLNRDTVVSGITFPPLAREQGADADLILRFRVEADTGLLREAKVVAGRSNKPSMLSSFIPGTEQAISTAQFRVTGVTPLPVATFCQTLSMHSPKRAQTADFRSPRIPRDTESRR